jgi:receptor protein-tyrosine kinase
MRHLVLTLIAIGIAGVAAVAATTAMLNSPMRIGPAASSTPTASQPGQTQAPVEGSAKPASKDIPNAPPAKGAAPQPATPATAEPAGAKPPAEGDKPADPDKDPYEGIAPEDLPPDLQYDADASVSFPTNT